ncbi:glutamine--fructose-6-phosphate transaminase (isomerizing) [Candidatus Parcubacteria bacterium]|nr:glutamine--fructose-6-phosphate transaminase (isomerizing) [Patescibacteria group bacterium]MBU4309880.1 glutamine--fructose-6-phosphate transaminase (isomerizing) [Patescibacteria group bacterium]MBU4431888.1 glutamine--fructose-6-phosphate transaminase (isomerizing) [Patescibacteria group bacterium]MBU4578219.1 glutamine--fructose-6-phosphate transaminase (isomerizing) [Patescibacteria group bacterium]MCG2696755.1 glutamine--fructose-6-phosphate transaminase (isomerizing) [Candidatus Parcu
MCGIVGYIGPRQAREIILDGLKRLEYRGYDSAGLAVVTSNGIECVKEVGRVASLIKKTETIKGCLEGFVGVGHTRWATHGAPSEKNAHPHFDCKKNVFLVHNGIIENYQELKKSLEVAGHIFVSETDTEVIAHLIEEYLVKYDITTAFRKAIRNLVGAYAIVMICNGEPDKIFVARHGSPVVIGVGDNESIIASGEEAIVQYTRKILRLKDGEIAIVEAGRYEIFSLDSISVERDTEHTSLEISDIEKGGFPHFMLKEIMEQPNSITNALRGRMNMDDGIAVFGGFQDNNDQLREVDNILIVACGTAYHAGLIGEYMIESLAGIPVKTVTASEFRYRPMITNDKSLVLVISQSGETADTLFAVNETNQHGCLTVGIVNVVGSLIDREVKAGVHNHAGPEISVASTKAFTSQVAILVLVTIYLARQRKMTAVEAQNIFHELQSIPEKVKVVLELNDAVRALAQKYSRTENGNQTEHFAYIGRGFNYPTALEGALKLKEISYIHAEGYPAGELKHGSIALICNDFPTMAIIPRDALYAKNKSSIKEIKARDGKIIAIATEGDEDIIELVDDVVFIPSTLDILYPILVTIVTQLFAYHMAVILGRDVDNPRNLAKSVTVE